LPDHLGVQRRAARGHPAQRVDELVGADDAVLEQVTDPARVVAQQHPGVRRLDPLREHQHGRVRVGGADGQGGPQTLVGEGRRHPHVDDRDVRAVLGDGGVQVLRVGRRGEHGNVQIGQ
jgi:hypothetical protein